MLLRRLLLLAGTRRYLRYPCAAALRMSQVFERKFKNLIFAHFQVCHGNLALKSVLQNYLQSLSI